jgi:dipeptidyl aminopeptidase/acylaminoacyl peptidase
MECSRRAGAMFEERVGSAFIRKALEEWLGGPPAQFPDRYAQASPITYVRKGAPPMLLLHGGADHIVPVSHSRRLAERLEAVGSEVCLMVFAHARHDLDERDHPSARLAAAASLTFLGEHLRSRRPGK